jgi:prepilin-type N-terminal cleavage/methylation domain-containing protein
MKKNNSLRAFSLIELSIVILIIGILIAGVTQSSRVLKQSRLTTARTLTQSAPTSSIKNLVLWIESTSTSSFDDAERDDGLTLTNWYDINPQASVKNDFNQSTTANKPVYSDAIINNLPVVKFDGAATYMTSANFSNITSGASTVFMVVKLPSTLASQPVFSKRPSAAFGSSAPNIQVSTNSTTTTGWQYCDAAAIVTSGTACNYSATSAGVVGATTYVLSVVYTGNTASGGGTGTATGVSFFQNGVLSGQAATTGNTPNASATGSLVVGKDGTTSPAFFGGYLGELIIFDRALKKDERQSVETYLGKKWNISMTAAAI